LRLRPRFSVDKVQTLQLFSPARADDEEGQEVYPVISLPSLCTLIYRCRRSTGSIAFLSSSFDLLAALHPVHLEFRLESSNLAQLSLHEVIVDEWMLLFDFPSWADLASIAYVSLIIYHSIPPDAVWSHMEGRLRNVRRTWDYSALESCFSLDEGMHYSELEGDSEYDHDEGPAHQACLGHDPEADLTLVLRRDQEVDCWHDFEECGFKLIFRKE
jgi:hypothetical protein